MLRSRGAVVVNPGTPLAGLPKMEPEGVVGVAMVWITLVPGFETGLVGIGCWMVEVGRAEEVWSVDRGWWSAGSPGFIVQFRRCRDGSSDGWGVDEDE